MKTRDITDLLCEQRDAQFASHFRPFVIIVRHGSAGYPVWLAPAESPEQAHRSVFYKQSLSEPPEQTLESYQQLPSRAVCIDGRRVTIYEAVPERAESPKAELLIGRVADNLYLWGVHNPE